MPNSVVTLSAPPLGFAASTIDRDTIEYLFQVGISAGNYTTGGLPCSFFGKVFASGIWSVDIFSYQSGNSGYNYRYNPDLGSSGAYAPYVAALGSTASYSILGGSGVTFAAATSVSGGNVGSYPTNSITGESNVTFMDSSAFVTAVAQNQTDLAAAIVYFNALTPTLSGLADLATGGNGSSASTYTPGAYFGATALDIPTSITLDAQGNSAATFVFDAGTTIVNESGAQILLINGAQACNVYFVANTSFTSIVTSVTNGNVLAHTSATIGGAQNGRVLANTGAVSVNDVNSVVVPSAVATLPSDNGGSIQIFTGSAAQSPMAELAAGATPAGVVNDNIRMVARFHR